MKKGMGNTIHNRVKNRGKFICSIVSDLCTPCTLDKVLKINILQEFLLRSYNLTCDLCLKYII